MYDVIGDIHGHAAELEQLLRKLDYQQTADGYRHPQRTALFVGDFIDRGPRIVDTLAIVRPMVESGAARAVLGNHEFNALAYHTLDPRRQRGFLRLHIEKNNRQHAATLKQLTTAELAEALAWFRTLPLYLDLDALRLVHACWSPRDITVVERGLKQHGGVSDGFLAQATDGHSRLFHAIEHVLKGPEIDLPPGQSCEDKDGHRRTKMRIQWFRPSCGGDLGDYAFPRQEASIGTLAEDFLSPVEPYAPDEPPVFFGHYWLTGDPDVQTANAACVDYSVAKGGKLAAYRWKGEKTLTREGFVSTPNRQGHAGEIERAW